MHPKTKELFYPDREEMVTAEKLNLIRFDDPDPAAMRDVITDEVLIHLDAELLAEHSVAIDREYEARLKAKEGQPGFNDDESVTAYEHEETLWNASNEWVLANVELDVLSGFTDMNEEELTNYLTEKVHDEAEPHDKQLWSTGKHPDDIQS